MPSYLLASVPVHGHVTPLLPIAAHLTARGDTVRFLTGARFAAAVTATGAEHVPLPDEADFDDRDVTASFPNRAELSSSAAIAFDMEHLFIRPARSQYALMSELLAQTETAAVITDPLFFGAAVLAEVPAADRPPVLVAGVVPLSLPGPGLAPFGMGLPPLGGPLGWVRNRILERVTARLFAPADAAAGAIMESAVGHRNPAPIMSWLTRADAVIQLSVPSFEYPRPDPATPLTFTGMLSTSSALEHPRPEWWGDLATDRPIVHVTQGTIANDDLSELILPTIRGLADRDVLVVAATGGRPIADLGALPANARAAEFLPYAELFTRTDVFVTNGGYGGVQFALAHGVPVVVAPGKEDKVEVAARVAWSGTGINLRTQRPDPRRLGRAVDRLVSEPRFRRAARSVAAEMAQAPGADGVAATVDSVVGRWPGRPGAGADAGAAGGATPVQRTVK